MESITRYLAEVSDAIRTMPVPEIQKAVDMLVEAWRQDRTAFIVGNGGSASTASHMMNDLTKLTRHPNRRPFKALAFTDNVPLMTAWANDTDYGQIFAEQLRTFASPGDVLIAISCSGNSPNVLRAVEEIKQKKCRTIALTGDRGGRLRDLADVTISVPSAYICQQEDAHMVLCHVLAEAVRNRIAASESTP